MAVGKRYSTDEPLTEHDLAERLNKAVIRAHQILYDIRVNLELMDEVKPSRYLAGGVLQALRAELDEWLPTPETPSAHATVSPGTTDLVKPQP